MARASSPWTELSAQLRTSVPETLGMLFSKVPWLVSLGFVGRIGSTELAAAALATSLCNVTGMSLCVGLSSAVTTLTGQARGQLLASVPTDGAESVDPGENTALVDSEAAPAGANYSTEPSPNTNRSTSRKRDQPLLLPLVYLYRGIFIQMLFVIPVGMWWLTNSTKSVLIFLGQGEELSSMTATYLRILTPGLWSDSINWTLTAWLQAIEMADLPASAALIAGILHIPFNLFFIHVLGLGWLGVGVATVLYQLVQPILMFSYLTTHHGSSRLLYNLGAKRAGICHLSFWKESRAAISSFSGIVQYLKLALPGILAVSEWWASEVAIFMAGKLHPSPEVALGAMAVYQSLNATCFMLPIGMSVAGSARISSCLGAGDPIGARLAARVCVVTAGCLSMAMGGILYFSPHDLFPSLFTPDKELIEMTSRTIPLLSIYVVADGLQTAFHALVKGCGRQSVLIPIVLIAYWAVGVPLSWHLAFTKHAGDSDCDSEETSFCGVTGLVGGLTMGTWIHMLLLAATVSLCINWDIEAQSARDRLTIEKRRNKKFGYPTIDEEISTESIHFNDAGASLRSLASVMSI